MDIKKAKQQEQIVEGCVTFGKGLTKKISKMLRIKNNIKILSSSKWVIKQLQLTQLQLSQHEKKSIFSYIKQARCNSLFVVRINSPFMLKEIFSVNFNNLSSLKLLNTGIYNIQIFAFMNLPHLQYFGLLLCAVDITKCLVKVHWPYIQSIVVRQQDINFSSRKEFMGRIKAKNQFKSLGLGWFDATFCHFSKFQAKKIERFQYYVLSNQYDEDLCRQRFNATFRKKYFQTRVSGIGNRVGQ